MEKTIKNYFLNTNKTKNLTKTKKRKIYTRKSDWIIICFLSSFLIVIFCRMWLYLTCGAIFSFFIYFLCPCVLFSYHNRGNAGKTVSELFKIGTMESFLVFLSFLVFYFFLRLYYKRFSLPVLSKPSVSFVKKVFMQQF